jgi:tetratricopeptide (TPR) repeat protein
MRVDDRNRDVLVTILALVTEAIRRPGVSTALSGRSKDRTQALAQTLVDEGVVDGERLRELERLASDHLKRHNNDLRLCLEAWIAQGLTIEVLTEMGDDLVQPAPEITTPDDGAIAAAQDSSGTQATTQAGDTVQPAGPSATPRLAPGDRFVPIRAHARGGIGQVWVARDCELQREVALKVILPGFADREDQRARFLIEAEITGNLEHPGIVPVYSLGRNAEGRPYYAMRFIRGESLSAAIRDFHGRSHPESGPAGGRGGSMWGITFRQLLGRFLDVCDAIDYAHSRGVLHRDIKPANIMLGQYGETLVVDWGLAKVVGKADILPPGIGDDFESSLATGTGELTPSGGTQPGTTIGTPAYMSPEQARGAIDELGPASDIYSLGATLYELLTGQVAFPGAKVLDVIQRVRQGDFRPPRSVRRSVPAPLEAICLKAMAVRPEARYGSVRELAGDLEHWLADEPVSAYPEGRLERAGRWLRQHRTWTYAAGAAVVGIALAATIGVVFIERGRRREADARALAQTNFGMANRAVRDYLTSVSQNTLLKQQDSVDLRDLRRELLTSALDYYKEFVRQREGDSQLRRELAEAHYRLGEIAGEIGTIGESIAAFEAAQSVWRELQAGAPDDPSIRAHLAECELAIGSRLLSDGQFKAARSALEGARDVLLPLIRLYPEVADYRLDVAQCYHFLGRIQSELGSPDEGLEPLERGTSLLKAWLARDPGDARFQRKLADIIQVRGFVNHKRRDYEAAIADFREVERIYADLLAGVTTGPRPIHLLERLALAHYNIAIILMEFERPMEALEELGRSLAYREALATAHPSVFRYQLDLGTSLGEIAGLEHRAKQDGKALVTIGRSIDVLEKLVGSRPEDTRFRAALGRSWNTLGFIRDEARENEQALPAFEHAVKEATRSMEEAPEVDQYRFNAIYTLDNLAEQSVDLGRPAEGFPCYRRAIALRQVRLEARPGDRELTLDLAKGLSSLGTILRHAGESPEARQALARAREVLAPAAAAAPADGALQAGLGAILDGEALALADEGRTAEAIPILRRAVATLKPAGVASRGEDPARGWLTESLWDLGRLLRVAGAGEEADRLDAERRDLWKDRPRDLAGLALQETRRAALIGYGRTPIGGTARSVRDRDLDQAADHLRMAVSFGFRDLPWLRADPDSWLLLNRVDLRTTILDLEFPEWPFEPRPR